MLTSFESAGTTPESQDLWKMIKRGPALTSTSSFRPLGWVPSGPMDLWTFSWYSWSFTVLVSTNGKSLFPHSSLSDSGDWTAKVLSVLLKYYQNALNASIFSSSLLVRWPSSTSIGPMFSLDLLLLLTYLKMTFMLSETTLASFSCNWALAFHVFSWHKWTTALYFCCEAWPCFQRPYCFFFLLSSMRSSLFSKAGCLPLLLYLWHSGIACNCNM